MGRRHLLLLCLRPALWLRPTQQCAHFVSPCVFLKSSLGVHSCVHSSLRSLAATVLSLEQRLVAGLVEHGEKHVSGVAAMDAQRAADLDLVNGAMQALETGLADVMTVHQTREVEKALSAAMHREIFAAFGRWAARAKHRKRIENLARRALHRAEHVSVGRAFLPWMEAGRKLAAERAAAERAAEHAAERAVERAAASRTLDIQRSSSASTDRQLSALAQVGRSCRVAVLPAPVARSCRE